MAMALTAAIGRQRSETAVVRRSSYRVTSFETAYRARLLIPPKPHGDCKLALATQQSHLQFLLVGHR